MRKSDTAEKERPATAETLPATQAESGLPAEMMQEMMADAGAGIPDNPNEDVVPFLYILQDLSPQVKKRDEKYIEGAEVGDIYNNATQDVYPARDGIEFIPCFFEAAYAEWRPNRAGFAGKHPDNTPLKHEVRMIQDGEKMVPTLPNGNSLVETKYWYGFFRPAGSRAVWEPGIIPMASSLIKVSRELVHTTKRTYIPGTQQRAPLWAVQYHFRTKLVKRNNNEWFVWDPEQMRQADGQPLWTALAGPEAYASARRFAQDAASGAVKTANPDQDQGVSEVDEEVL